jgi:hypothetical protein
LHGDALIDAGLANPKSSQQALAFLQRRGHGDHLMRNGNLPRMMKCWHRSSRST